MNQNTQTQQAIDILLICALKDDLAGVFELLNNVALWLSLILFVLFVIAGLYASFVYWRWNDQNLKESATFPVV